MLNVPWTLNNESSSYKIFYYNNIIIDKIANLLLGWKVEWWKGLEKRPASKIAA